MGVGREQRQGVVGGVIESIEFHSWVGGLLDGWIGRYVGRLVCR